MTANRAHAMDKPVSAEVLLEAAWLSTLDMAAVGATAAFSKPETSENNNQVPQKLNKK